MPEEKSRRRTPYPAEVRERAVRLVLDHEDEYPSQWAAIDSVTSMLNSRPRKVLGWRTPAEMFDEHLRSLQQAGVATID